MKNLIIVTLLTFAFSSTTLSQLGIKGGLAIGKSLNQKTSDPYLGFNAGLTYEFNHRFRGEILIEGMYTEQEFTYLTTHQSQASTIMTTETARLKIIPITLGADYRILTGKLQPYVGLNMGMMTIGNTFKGENYNSQYFTFHPKVGLNFEMTENLKLDMNIKHHISMRQNQTGLFDNQVFGFNLGVNCNF